MENLRYLLYQYNPNDSLYLGHRYSIDANKRGYMAGMSYILSKEALKRFHYQLMGKKCRNDEGGAEDLEMGKCLENSTIQVDTRDEKDGHRFFPVSPSDAMDPFGTPYWYQKNQFYKINIGLNCCSETAIGFHYVDISHMYLMEYLFYKVHPFGISRNISYTLPEKIGMQEILQSSLGIHL
jgi:glycoprotein-N-acetylgalactosamine 3-beta-galactosyltransferase